MSVYLKGSPKSTGVSDAPHHFPRDRIRGPYTRSGPSTKRTIQSQRGRPAVPPKDGQTPHDPSGTVPRVATVNVLLPTYCRLAPPTEDGRCSVVTARTLIRGDKVVSVLGLPFCLCIYAGGSLDGLAYTPGLLRSYPRRGTSPNVQGPPSRPTEPRLPLGPDVQDPGPPTSSPTHSRLLGRDLPLSEPHPHPPCDIPPGSPRN